MKNSLALTLTTLIVISSTNPAAAGGLSLTVDGVRNENGSVLVLVFDNSAAFEKLDWSKAIQFAEIPARKGRVSYLFADLTSGPYAVFVLHDENGDQDLNYKGERLLEGIGATGITASTPYPNFAQASVLPGKVTVQLSYDE